MTGPTALGPSSVPPSPPNRDRDQVHPKIREAAEGMESMFLDYMMRVMRQTVQKSEMSLDNSASEIYQSMLDSEYAQQAVKTGGVGLADQIIAYLEGQRYTLERGNSPSPGQMDRPAARTGGTQNEGRPVQDK